jgi:DNA (cytosine-5)-methyltransferase 1
MQILDLYSGMGGLSLGFALALRDAEITGLDIDRDAVETYNLNLNRFRARACVQDVIKWKPEGDYDVVIGGSPCQPFSRANVKNPGEKHPLFPTFPRFFDIVLELKPKAFLLENVKGLTTKKFRQYLDRELSRISRAYVTEWRVLNAVNYGVPQKRERLIIVGVRRDLGLRPSFPKTTHGEKSWITLREAIGDLLALPPAKENITKPIAPDHVMTPEGGWDNPRSDWGSRVMRLEKPAYTITEKHRSGQLVPIPPAPSTTLSKPSPSLVADARIYATGRREHGKDVEKGCYRRLTVRECLRIQSFPDWWRFPEHVSVSKRYRLVGEAVPPVFAYRLAVAIARVLGLETREPPREEEWQLPYFKRAFADYFGG